MAGRDEDGGQILMERKFHELAPLIALQFLPIAFRDWFLCSQFTEADIKRFAVAPDEEDHSNIEQDCISRHGHSYKMEMRTGRLRYLDGDCLINLKAHAMLAHEAIKRKQPDLARQMFATASHFIIDGQTYPHLHRGRPWSLFHQKFEIEMADWLSDIQDIGPFEFVVWKDIYRAARAIAINTWPKGLEVVAVYQAREKIAEDLRHEIARSCIQAVGNLFLTLAARLELI